MRGQQTIARRSDPVHCLFLYSLPAKRDFYVFEWLHVNGLVSTYTTSLIFNIDPQSLKYYLAFYRKSLLTCDIDHHFL